MVDDGTDVGSGKDATTEDPSKPLPSVCVVTHPLGPAGENATRSLLDILAALTSVSLVTADLPADSTIRDDHEVVELTMSGPGSNLAIAAGRFALNQLRMCRELRRRDEEVVLFFGATAYLLPILFAKLLGKTVVLEPRGDVPLTLRLQWERRFPSPLARGLAGAIGLLEQAGYRLADGIVTYTPSMAEELGLDRYEHKLYPEGARYVDVERFRPDVPFEERDRVVGFLGRLDEEKNVGTLAEVAKRLPQDVTFRFIGDGELRPWLERELAAKIKAGSVEITGWADHEDVPGQLNELRLLVLLSEPTEGLPTVILEAMACGTPVYASPVSGVPDLVKEEETGFLLNEHGADEVASRIVAIQQRDDLAEVSENCRGEIESRYSFEAAIGRYRRILGQV